MPGPDETRTITGWKTASKWYRRPPGLGWLLALIAVPLLLGLIGWAGLDRADRDVDMTLPTVDPNVTLTPPDINAPALSFAPLSILRNGDNFTLSGDLPDENVKASLLDRLRGAFGPDINLTDNLNIKAGVNAPDMAGMDGLLRAAVDIPDFNFDLNGDIVALSGTAPSEAVKAAVEAAAKSAWPNINVVNNIAVAPPAAPPAPPAPQAPAPVAGAPAPGGACATLQADITGLLRTPIIFATDGFTLTPPSEQLLTQIADKVKACPNARLAVVGHTDNTGNDVINVPLSNNRAKSVAEYLVSHGIAGDRVTSRGVGAAEPIASNDTPDGRAQNRRVVITVVS